MTVRGTRNLMGREATELLDTIQSLRELVECFDFEPFVPSVLASAELFDGQIGDNRTYEFRDRSDRRLVLTPEITAIVREEYRNNWSKSLPKPVKIWYATRCYRYDRPQRGRYREFWQFGVEIFDANKTMDIIGLLDTCLGTIGVRDYERRLSVQRGLGYYIENGFEIWKDEMQIAGGGRYAEGLGFAIGLDRALLVRG